MSERGKVLRKTLIVLILIGVIIGAYFQFFFYYKCEDNNCFRARQETCSKTKYISDTEDTTWLYQINGKTADKCEIDVNVLQIKKGTLDKQILEGKSMTCLVNLGTLSSPESDITKCHGVLKEELQNLIIQRLHSYILENIGNIGEGLTQ
jgi:hypothetical protein